MRHAISFRLGLLGATLSISTVQAQEVPRTYPPAAPSAADSVFDSRQLHDPKQFANQSVIGMGPSKGLIVRYERVAGNFSIKSTGVGGVADYKTDVSKNAILTAKLYAPLLNHPHLKVVLGLNYERQEFQFEKPAAIEQYSLYNNIENKALSTIGTQLAIIRPVDDVHWYIFPHQRRVEWRLQLRRAKCIGLPENHL